LKFKDEADLHRLFIEDPQSQGGRGRQLTNPVLDLGVCPAVPMLGRRWFAYIPSAVIPEQVIDNRCALPG
jgi:hypothetical protein